MLNLFLGEWVGERAIHHALGEAQSLCGELLGYVIVVDAAQGHEIILGLVLYHQRNKVVDAACGVKNTLRLRYCTYFWM